jgi:hypothetical protein
VCQNGVSCPTRRRPPIASRRNFVQKRRRGNARSQVPPPTPAPACRACLRGPAARSRLSPTSRPGHPSRGPGCAFFRGCASPGHRPWRPRAWNSCRCRTDHHGPRPWPFRMPAAVRPHPNTYCEQSRPQWSAPPGSGAAARTGPGTPPTTRSSRWGACLGRVRGEGTRGGAAP